jgi:hypothetical protein
VGKKRHPGSPERNLPNTSQRSLAFVGPAEEPRAVGRNGAPVFRKGKAPKDIFIGETALPDYLRSLKLGWVARLRNLVWELDYTAFFSSYQGTGRQPFHPAIIVGLIVYGMLKRQWSLRDLESLARIDVGAWLMCGGIQPDHSTIGKFIVRHQELLTEEFFVTATRALAAKLRLSPGKAAIDGTVIEAAGSHYRALRAEALETAAAKAQTVAQRAPEDAAAQKKAQQMERAVTASKQRQQGRRAAGKDPKSVQVAVTEPEAMVQSQKNKSTRPSYKGSLMAIPEGLITGQAVDPSSETAVVNAMLDQYEATMWAQPLLSLLDAGYFSIEMLGLFVAREIDVLIPAGKATGTDDIEKRQRKEGKLLKNRFIYDDATDTYTCPAGQILVARERSSDRNGRYRRYRGVACATCSMKAKCTTSDRGRTIKRYDGDELKEAMIEVLRHPRARQDYRARSHIAERPLAELKTRQGLTRFHRRGLRGAAVEFSLHCIAYNLGRVVARFVVHGICIRFRGRDITVDATRLRVVMIRLR